MGVIGTTKVVPCYKALFIEFFRSPPGISERQNGWRQRPYAASSFTFRAEYLVTMRAAQARWAGGAVRDRVGILRRLRGRLAADARAVAETVPTSLPGALHRSVADTLVSEVLPLIEACRFLERQAERILQTRRLGMRGRPVWLTGMQSEVERAPWGVVLVIAPANYPLLLAGVQTLQALVGGNAVLWKPAPGTEKPARVLREMLVESGLDGELLTILESDAGNATAAIAAGVDHVVLTGSAETGRAVLRQLAETLTPATMELSGCDAVFVLPGADLERTAGAIVFGMRFNGSFTCMAPRRVFLVGFAEGHAANFEARLAEALRELGSVAISAATAQLLHGMVREARGHGAEVVLDGLRKGVETASATLITGATPDLLCMQASVFAPVLSVMRTANLEEALAADASCQYGLTASVFGPEAEARKVAGRLRVGHVLINDVVIPTADPRVSFGGRGRSGFGVTRGMDGLLAMTTPKTVQVSRGDRKRAWAATGEGHVEFFAGLAAVLHGDGLRARVEGLKRVVRAARTLN